jgi:hypothetical protein
LKITNLEAFPKIHGSEFQHLKDCIIYLCEDDTPVIPESVFYDSYVLIKQLDELNDVYEKDWMEVCFCKYLKKPDLVYVDITLKENGQTYEKYNLALSTSNARELWVFLYNKGFR